MSQPDEDGNGRVDRLLPPREKWKRTTAAMLRLMKWTLAATIALLAWGILLEWWRS